MQATDERQLGSEPEWGAQELKHVCSQEKERWGGRRGERQRDWGGGHTLWNTKKRDQAKTVQSHDLAGTSWLALLQLTVKWTAALRPSQLFSEQVRYPFYFLFVFCLSFKILRQPDQKRGMDHVIWERKWSERIKEEENVLLQHWRKWDSLGDDVPPSRSQPCAPRWCPSLQIPVIFPVQELVGVPPCAMRRTSWCEWGSLNNIAHTIIYTYTLGVKRGWRHLANALSGDHHRLPCHTQISPLMCKVSILL